jgi:hypothetical protein
MESIKDTGLYARRVERETYHTGSGMASNGRRAPIDPISCTGTQSASTRVHAWRLRTKELLLQDTGQY